MFRSYGMLISLMGLALVVGMGCGDDTTNGTGGSGGAGATGGTGGVSGGVGGAGGGAGGSGGAGGGAGGSGGVPGTGITQDIPAACLVSFNGALADFPVTVTIDPSPISANMPFTADITAALVVTEAFIEAALEVIPTLMTVDVSLAQATIGVLANATGPDVVSSLSPVPQTFDFIADTNGNGIPGPLVVPLSTETGSYTAGAAGTNIEFDLVGSLVPPSGTQLDVVVLDVIPVTLTCEPGTANDNGTPDDDADDFVNPQDPTARISFPIP